MQEERGENTSSTTNVRHRPAGRQRPGVHSEMDQPSVSGKNFYVHLAGITHGAHLDFVVKLTAVGHVEVLSVEQSDYILLFCPISSRVGSDISAALQNIAADKPTILVVMHHTFNPKNVIANSRDQVTEPNVLLTVDCFFFGRKLLTCNRNELACYEIQKFWGISPSQVSSSSNYKYDRSGYHTNRKLICTGVFVGMLLTAIIVTLAVFYNKK